jgi:hypothetical protein
MDFCPVTDTFFLIIMQRVAKAKNGEYYYNWERCGKCREYRLENRDEL